MTQPSDGITVPLKISNEQIQAALIPTLHEFVNKESLDIKARIDNEIRSYGKELLELRSKAQDAESKLVSSSASFQMSVHELKINAASDVQKLKEKAELEIKSVIEKHRNQSLAVVLAILSIVFGGTAIFFSGQLLSLSDQIGKSKESISKLDSEVNTQLTEASKISEKIKNINALIGTGDGVESITTKIISIRENLSTIVEYINQLKFDLKSNSYVASKPPDSLVLK